MLCQKATRVGEGGHEVGDVGVKRHLKICGVGVGVEVCVCQGGSGAEVALGVGVKMGV